MMTSRVGRTLPSPRWPALAEHEVGMEGEFAFGIVQGPGFSRSLLLPIEIVQNSAAQSADSGERGGVNMLVLLQIPANKKGPHRRLRE